MGLMVMSCFGSLLGWQFTIANVFKGAADEGYFPKLFSKITSKDAPVVGYGNNYYLAIFYEFMTISPSLK